MIDSTNPRQMADNIKELNKRMINNDVEGNPSGSGFNTLLTKLKIDGKKYKLPNQVTANPAGEASDEIEKIDIGGTVYSLGGGGGYTPNYSETEAEVGITYNGSPVYGRLVKYTRDGDLSSNWDVINSSVTFPDGDRIIKAEAVIQGYAECVYSAIQAYFDNVGAEATYKVKAKTFASVSPNPAKDSYVYIEYTKVASE